MNNVEVNETVVVNEEKENKSMFKKALGKVKEIGTVGVEKVKGGIEWIKDNPIDATYYGTMALGAAAIAVMTGTTVKAIKEGDKSTYCDDVQMRVNLKHSLTSDEINELSYRMSTGQTKFQALEGMGVVDHTK